MVLFKIEYHCKYSSSSSRVCSVEYNVMKEIWSCVSMYMYDLDYVKLKRCSINKTSQTYLALLQTNGVRILFALSHAESDVNIETVARRRWYVWRPEPVVNRLNGHVTYGVDTHHVASTIGVASLAPLKTR